jgi:twitching motility protein PilT
MQLEALLNMMAQRGASDLHLKPKRPPLLRLHGKLFPIDGEVLKPEDIEGMILPILSPRQKQRLDEALAVDIGYGIHGLARFRGNIYRQRGTLAASFRRIPYEISTVDDLDLPPVLLDFCDLPMGLVLVTGPTGSGKSTTLAALIKHISETRPVHVLTIEDPMEFLFIDSMAAISQREVGTDTISFTEALRNGVRQDPDVMMVGEMRDVETMTTVITAAETGHLVFSTLHTNSATQTIDRILDSFPSTQHKQVRAQLSMVLKGVVSMQLVERRDGSGLVAALEILKSSPKISSLVDKGETAKIHEQLESSVSYYRMQSMNQSLLALLVNGTITYREAMRRSPDPEDLSLKLRKMFPKIEELGGDMGVSSADYSTILELQEFRKLYEDQEERVKIRLGEKDEQIAKLRDSVSERNAEVQQLRGEIGNLRHELDKARSEYDRMRGEAQARIDKLSERIKDLSQQVVGVR